MKFFIDTANISQIKQANDLGILDGVTTNPTLMKKEGIKGQENILAHYKKICDIVDGPVSAEVLSTNKKEMLAEANILKKIHKNIVIKVPMTIDGLQLIKELSMQGIKTNCTLIFSATQALLAAKAGATYVSPFIGRIDDMSNDGLSLVEDMRLIFDNYNIKTNILVASVRHSIHVLECAKIGADFITVPLSVIMSLLYHPLTDLGLSKFVQDAKSL